MLEPAWTSLSASPDFAILHLSDWSAIAQLVLAATALAALLGAGIQIHISRSTSRQALTYNFTQRFASPELLPYQDMTHELFMLGASTEDERYGQYLDWEYEKKLAALIVPNLIEELAGMYNKGLLHRGIAKDYFGDTALELWTDGRWFIERFQSVNPNFYSQWKSMLEDMRLI